MGKIGAFYSYEPIQHDQLRLIKFDHIGDRTAAVLQTFPLEGPTPPYYALSYSWLTESAATGATIEGNHVLGTDRGYLPVLDTVTGFLRNLVSKEKNAETDYTWWWIDSLCINLKDMEERSHQVQLMGQIYNNAHSVIIWLGEEGSQTDRAVDFIQLLSKHIRQRIRSPVAEIRHIFQHPRYQSHWDAMASFFQRRWWSRTWTLQEHAMNDNVSFWWGLRSFSLFEVEGALMGADQCTSIPFKGTTAFRHGFNRGRVQTLYKERQIEANKHQMSLVALAAYSSCFEATDDRDRLYGIKGLATDTSFLDVDYTWSVEETYIRFTKAFIDHYKSLDVICFASIYSALPGSALPSWVPDWRARIDTLSVPLMVSQSAKTHIGNLRASSVASVEKPDGPPLLCYAASRDSAAVYTFRDSKLVARGFVVDVVDGLAASKNAELVQSSAQLNLTEDASERTTTSNNVIRKVCKSLVLDRKDRFLRFAMPTDEFFRDFAWLCGQLIIETPSPVLKEFQEWYNNTKSLLFHGRSFESILRDSLEVLDIASAGLSPNQDEYIFDSFYGRFYDVVVRMSLCRLIVTRNGHIGLTSEKARKGDLIVVLFGCSVPILLRRSDEAAEESYVSVGECFLDGFMDGRGLDRNGYVEKDFCIA
ncbi:heterokaryon incompatibility protein-domain-containing protein [Plectosphaerella plurivora]|uniref:Heterokaryon incompatibility protein-domain-containing protein n=1 Tax=Plectosphaerella plurivora TaxID=936078 RepID=A0A9P9A9W3_9PEZI|nr:heterokaryon incompatibility protein-domain-containing protein [Plectosphaerella plurivora]